MSKRLVRLQGGKIEEELAQLKNREIDLVLKSGAVIHGLIISNKDKTLIVKNAVRNKVKVEIASILEIVYDVDSTY